MNRGGDVLARGEASAQFAGASASLTDFENDFIYMEVVDVLTKYGLAQAEYDQYQAQRDRGERLPDLRPITEEKQELSLGFSIADHRKNYLSIPEEVKVSEEEVKKYPDPQFHPFTPIMDRILVMRITDNPDEELLEDGSIRNKKTGLITAAKYRQHSNIGIVLKTGLYVVLSGVRFDMSEFLEPGDKVTFGDYNSEIFPMDEVKVQELCDALEINYVKDPQGSRIVRAQDIRGVEKRVKAPVSTYNVTSYTYQEVPNGTDPNKL